MIKNRFQLLLNEAIKGLPDSYDPYAGSERISQSKPSLGDLDSGLDLGSSVEGEDENKGEVDINKASEKMSEPEKGQQIAPPPPSPTTPTWKLFPLPNKKDVGLRRSDGFILRMRKLGSIPNKWLAQVFSGNKVLDKGQVIVPQDVDPIAYIRDMADHMLDKLSERDVEYQELAPDEGLEGMGGMGGDEAEPVVPGLEKEGESEDLSELGLFDDNFEME